MITRIGNSIVFYGAGEVFSCHHSTLFEWRRMMFCDTLTAVAWAKAAFFGDLDVAKKALHNSRAANAKHIYCSVTAINAEMECELNAKWERALEAVVFDILLSKFSQHQDLRNKIASCDGLSFVYADKTDSVLGAGRSIEDMLDGVEFSGQNIYGLALDRVASTLGKSESDFLFSGGKLPITFKYVMSAMRA